MAWTIRIVANRRNPEKIPQAEEEYLRCTLLCKTKPNEANLRKAGFRGGSAGLCVLNYAEQTQFAPLLA